jgi:hypothetical protein
VWVVRLAFVGDDALIVADEIVRVVEVDGTRDGVEMASHELSTFQGDTVLDIAGLERDLWAAVREAHRSRCWLVRCRLDGTPVGERIALPSPDGQLITSPQARSVVWNSDPALLVASTGDASPLTLEPGLDAAVPLGAARYIVARGTQVAMRSNGVDRWTSNLLAPSTRVTDGTMLFEGSSVALLASNQARPASLLVLALRAGEVQRRFTFTDVTHVRFAALRGQALLVAGDRRLILVDLRFARTIGEYTHDRAIAGVAIDATGTRVAIYHRSASGTAVLTCLLCREAFTTPKPASSGAPDGPSPDEQPAMTERPSVTPEPEPLAPPEPPVAERAPIPLTLHDPPALWPRPRTPQTNRVVTLQILERERALISALGYRAITTAWDMGRLVFANENEHPYETEIQGLLGRQRGRATTQLSDAENHLAEARNALAAIERTAAGSLTPIDGIVAEFGLSPLARSILLVVAAPRIWGEIARIYGVVGNDTQRAIVDEMLVRQILGSNVGVHDIARELDNDRPLIRHGLVRLGPGVMRPFLTLQVDSLVIKRLRGDPLGAGADPQLTICDAQRPLDRLELPPGVPEALQAALVDNPERPLRLVVRGRVGCGRRTLLAALAETAHRRLAIFDIIPMLRDGRLKAEVLRDGLLRAMLGGWLPCVDNLDAVGSDDRTQRDLVRDVLAGHPGPLTIRLGASVQPPLDPGYVCIDLPPLPEGRRAEVWRATLAERGLEATDVDELAARWVVGPGIVHRVVSTIARQGTTTTPLVARIDAAVREQLESRLGEIATRVQRLASWSEVVLPPDVLDSLLELISRIRNRRTVFDSWGFDRVMATSRGLTALFQGGPGTGKTMVAGAIARELGLDVYRVDVSRVVSKWIGETEKNLAQVFDAAEDGHAILLFDEADSLFSKRTEVKSSVDRYANLEVNYLLQRLDSFSGIAILTTNFGGGIDTAFKRRLSFRLSFPFPDEEMREQLWKVHLPAELPRAGTIDTGELARKYKMSGGYIRNSVLRAAFLAAAEQSALRQEHLERAVKLEYREIGKLVDTGALE